jgi:hypothetical protein
MNHVHRGGQTGCEAASYRRDRRSRLPSLVGALASAWQEIALRHPELPPVLMGIGPSSRATAKRRCHAHFTPAAWSPVGPNASAALKASSRALDEAIARRDLDALSDLLATSAGLLIGEALQLSHDAHRIRAEVLVTADGLAGSAVDLLGLLLHAAGHALASERGVKDASRQGRYHNREFKTIEELGLDVGQDPPFGWTATTVPAATAARYTDALAILSQELSSARGEFALSRRPRIVRSHTCRCGEHVRSGRARVAPLAVLCTACGQSGSTA